MKIIFAAFTSIFLMVGLIGFSQNTNEPYFIYQKGAKIKIGHFTKMNIPTSFTVYTITDVVKTDTMNYLTLKVETLDKYQKFVMSKDFSASYFDGEIDIDKLFLIPIDSLPEIPQSDIDVMGRNFIIPSFLGDGIELSAAWVEVKIDSTSSVKVSEYSRVVDAFEKITTDIGDFDACLISSKLERKFGDVELFTVYTWYSKGIGPVRTNYYNLKRKLVKYSEVVEIYIPKES
jgi:hypothetical protein